MENVGADNKQKTENLSLSLKTEGIEQPTNRNRNSIPRSVWLRRKMKRKYKKSIFPPKILDSSFIKHLVTLKPAI